MGAPLTFKILVLTCKALNSLGLGNLWDRLSCYVPQRALHSSNENQLVIPNPNVIHNHSQDVFGLGSNLVELSVE